MALCPVHPCPADSRVTHRLSPEAPPYENAAADSRIVSPAVAVADARKGQSTPQIGRAAKRPPPQSLAMVSLPMVWLPLNQRADPTVPTNSPARSAQNVPRDQNVQKDQNVPKKWSRAPIRASPPLVTC
jgi:hypothetical protein